MNLKKYCIPMEIIIWNYQKSDLIGEVVLLVVWSLSEVLLYRYCLGETSNRGIYVQHSQITVFLCFMPIINTF